jgi:hypothetical protein
MDFDQWGPFVVVGFGFFILICLSVAVFVWYKIIGRTGYSPWLSLLMVVPLANLVVMLVLAFSEWPIQREVATLRSRTAGGI